MRLLHSADWQIGARFRQFGAQAGRLREARVRTLRRVLEMAAGRHADALLIAGDLFEDHQIEPAAVAEVFDLFASHDAVPIFILPGNHDPIGSPSAIWARRPFVSPPAHVKIFATAEAVPLAGGFLIANPLTQKQSALDPSLRLADLARERPAGAIKIGMTHGSPAIGGMHQPDDFPIALDAAARAGLDFLALGHWHSALSLDGGRMLMAGTPEPTDFAERGSGSVHEIEIERAGAVPKITALPCGEMQWRHLESELATGDELLAQLAACDPARTVVRVTLGGLAAPEAAAAWGARARELAAAFAASDFRDETTPDFTAGELAELQRDHPLLTQVLDDLNVIATNVPALPRHELEGLEKRVGCAPGELTAPLVEAARRVLMRELREATAC
ncbi:MAG TPA: DNA repair exonuclease [Chthoniobacteraceae bacterium]|jgi:DNA repair exonuclease SbcCD nuclease subunit|nr:DNA repair exonuclease [Chthoniobacteraceae bacterium]